QMIEKFQGGDWFGGMIDLLGAGLGLYQASKACFVAGTPIRGEHGSRPVEEFQVGDRVWSRSENDPAGPVELKEIEEVFVRFAPVISLHVGGQVIGTTGEHPFYAENRGWVAAHDLTPEDRILTEDGRWLNVEEVFDTGKWQTVYNFRVRDHHTYFAGDAGWGFGVWAHNAHYAETTHTDSNGNLVSPNGAFTSGGYTLKNGQTNSWKLQAYSHTEAKIARHYRKILNAGDTLVINGTLPPCDTYAGGCQRMMSELARKTGGIIKYKWRDGDGVAHSMTFERNIDGNVTSKRYVAGKLTNVEIRVPDPLGAGFWLRRS
uniref:polymorphic toxin-type HINT domain-containing protein n=1 Tax=Zavarzinella formosa TaxID=360055 RepID=UPI000592C5AB